MCDYPDLEHLVDLITLLGREALQGLRSHAGVGFQEGVLISFQRFYAFLVPPHRSQLALGCVAGLVQLCQGFVQFFIGHVPLGGEPVIAAALLVYLD